MKTVAIIGASADRSKFGNIAVRAFVRQGLGQLAKLSRPGLKALAGIAKTAPPFNAHHLGFVFGPRINAGGRVGRSGLGAG